jgi:two-component system nitrate/nitrite sensor histidine kinase NarX
LEPDTKLRQKKTIPIADSTHSAFVWVRHPDFTPPNKEAGFAARLTNVQETPRAGDLRSLLETFLESIIGTINATAGVVRLLSPDGCTLQIISSAGLSAELQKEAESFVELNCEVNDTATLGHIIHSSDISTCDSRHRCPYASCRVQSLVAAPLEAQNAASTPLGILTIFFDVPRTAASQVMNTLAAFAEVMAATIEHTRMTREVQRTDRLAARQDIANEIHDSLAQTLTYSRMRASLLREAIRTGKASLAAQLTNDIDEALEIGQKSVRHLIADFRCEINHGGLAAGLQDLVSDFRKRNDIVLEYHNRLVEFELPLEHEIQVYYVVREALTNIARHSGASHARLFVDAEFGYYVFTIEDNGSGASTFKPIEGHYGVIIMRERAQRIGGEIRVKSAAGLGTQVQLFFPEPPTDWRVVSE